MTKMTKMTKTTKTNAPDCYLASLFLSLVFLGCASAPAEQPRTAANEQPAPISAPEAPKAEQPPAPPEPELSPELKKLRSTIQTGNANDIKAAAHEIIDLAPGSDDSLEALRALAMLAMSEKNFDEAQLYADAASEIRAKDLDTLLLKAKISIHQNRFDDANKLLKTAIETFPDAPEPHILKASVAIRFLDSERALENASAAAKLAPQNCDAIIIHGDALYLNLKYEASIAAYEKADTSRCNLTEAALLNMAKMYEVQLQAPDKACKSYERLVKLSPDNAYYKASRDYQCSL